MKKAKKAKEWSRRVELGSACEIVSSINEHARQRNSILAGISD